MPRIVHVLGDLPDDRKVTPRQPEVDLNITSELAWCLDPYAPVPSGYEVDASTNEETA